MSFGGKNPILHEADVILILDTDVPWVDAQENTPKQDARIFVVDPDPLKQGMGWSHVDAELVCRADAEVALSQLHEAVNLPGLPISPDSKKILSRKENLQQRHDEWIHRLQAVETTSVDGPTPTVVSIISTLRQTVIELTPSRGQKTLWINECSSNLPIVFDHVRPDIPDSMICSGGTSIGYCLGAAVGAQLGAKVAGKEPELTLVVVGDGTFLFCVPSAAYWMARRYETVCTSYHSTSMTCTECS